MALLDKLPSVPHILDFARTEEDKEIFKLVFMRDVIGRAIIVPPNIPRERRHELRMAFDATVKDATFLTAAGKLDLPIESLSSAEDGALVDDLK